MKKAGLTHGGFRAHFKDRDELVAEAVRAVAAETADRVLSGAPGGLEAILEAYLSRADVERPAEGCVLAALGTEAGRQRPRCGATFIATRGMMKIMQATRRRPVDPRSS